MSRRIARFIALASLAVLIAAPARAATGFPDAPWVGAIQTQLMAFNTAYKRWPADVPELQGFAAARGQRLDLSGFKKLSFSQRAPQSILVEYETDKPSHQEGAFAVAVYEVRPRQPQTAAATAATAARLWYCGNPAGYYPAVPRCSVQWQSVSASSQASSNQLWYYCANPPGYYPYIQSCPTPWQPVPAR